MTIFKEVTGQGPDLVLFHGWCCNHRHMRPFVEQLSKHYRVHNFDTPGAGESDWNPSIETIHDIADEVIPHLPDKAIYIGWSFGGILTTSIAARYPERVERFIGICTLPKFISDEKDGWVGVPQPGYRFIFDTGLANRKIEDFLKDFYDMEYIDEDPKPENYHTLVSFIPSVAKFNRDVLFKGIDICDTTDLRNEFATLQCPIDMILGEKDGCVPAAAYDKLKVLNLKVNIHVVEGAGHIPFWTHQKEFNKILKDIL